MAEGTASNNQDWHIPAILVAVIVMLGLIGAVIVGVRALGSDDDSVAAQLERWSSCLRSEGANVPLVESLRDGGFRVTVDGSLVHGGLDKDSLGPALDECEDQAPETVRNLMNIINGFTSLPIDGFGPGMFEFDGSSGFPFADVDEFFDQRDTHA